MLKKEILEDLIQLTKEEKDNLAGVQSVDRSIFLNDSSNIIDYHKLLSDDQSFTIRRHTRFQEYPSHRHNYLEFMYVYSGEMTHIIHDQKITIREGELLLLNQNIEHSILYTKEKDIIFNLIIKTDFLVFMASLIEEESELFSFLFEALYSNKNDGEYLLFKAAHNKHVKTIIEDLIQHVYEPAFNQSLILKLTMGLLLTELMNHPEDIEAYTGNSYEKILSGSILKYIDLHYQEGSLSQLAKNLHQPDYKICKIIKKHTGFTFKQLVQKVRLQHAVRLLKTTHLPIVEIMEKVGYDNITYFYKIFKDTYHRTPKQYREHAK
ncbi:AraC family transcriptional regulator [Beduini massiliensis]|uniref:AraC family transcriptional regulator n=1 Tax=Beduini massiliensis TaxID=1585974 RepID=UPI00059A8697|nr:AraC family transcriptional regulator [Beduini massiliensis]